MWKFSLTARPAADSEIVGEEDDGGLGLEPSGGSLLGCLRVKPQKLNAFTYTSLTVSFACIFTHTHYTCINMWQSVGLPHVQTLVVASLLLSSLYLPLS